MAKTTLTVDVEYDDQVTDPESIAAAADRLLETALSTPGIMEDYADPRFGEFFVLSPVVSKLIAACQVVVANWEQGDLAAAARLCAEAVNAAAMQLPAASKESLSPPNDREVLQRWVLYDLDADSLLSMRAYADYDEAVGDAERANDILVFPLEIVGHDCNSDEQPVEEDGREQAIDSLVAKAEAAGLKAENLDGIVHELASSIAADINNEGMEGQISYLIEQMGLQTARKEIERLVEGRENA